MAMGGSQQKQSGLTLGHDMGKCLLITTNKGVLWQNCETSDIVANMSWYQCDQSVAFNSVHGHVYKAHSFHF